MPSQPYGPRHHRTRPAAILGTDSQPKRRTICAQCPPCRRVIISNWVYGNAKTFSLCLSPSLSLPQFTLHCGNDTNFQLNSSPWNSLNGKWCQTPITKHVDSLTMPLMDMEKSPLWDLCEVQTDSITTASKSPVTSSFSQNRVPCLFSQMVWCQAIPWAFYCASFNAVLNMRCPTKVSGMKPLSRVCKIKNCFTCRVQAVRSAEVSQKKGHKPKRKWYNMTHLKGV